jgi:hypothetical protein
MELLVVAAARMPVRDPKADAPTPLYHVSVNTPSFSPAQCVPPSAGAVPVVCSGGR